MYRLTGLIILILSVCLIPLHCFAASPSWEYGINTVDTPTMLDTENTTAEVDTTNNEIRLPKFLPSAASFWPDGSPDFAALGVNKIIHFSYDQVSGKYIENPFLSIDLPDEELLAVVAVDPFPELVVVTKTNSYHYSFDGSNMVVNPLKTATELKNVFAAGAYETDKISLRSNNIEAYSFNGTSTQRNNSLESSGSFNRPLDVAMYPDRRGMAVAEPNKIRTFLYTGLSMLEVPFLSISDISEVKDVTLGENFRIAGIVGTEQKEWGFDLASFSMKEIPMLKVTGLSSPKCVALRPGTYDRVILDGNQYKYYYFNGTGLTYDINRSVTVNGVENLGGYSDSAVAISKTKDPGWDAEKVRVRAYHTLPEGTSTTWSVTADGTSWVKRWRVRGTSAGTIAEISNDNGITWIEIGDASFCTPDAVNDTRTELYADVTPGRNVIWKVLLETTDVTTTPVIKPAVGGGIAIKWESGNPPDQPVVTVPLPGGGSCFTTSAPIIQWNYTDPDNDVQGAYQVLVRRKSDGTLVYDSGKRVSSNHQHTIPTSDSADIPGVLWSSGTYLYTVEIKVWDSTGLESDWCAPADFCVVAFDRPRIAEIVSPPPGQAKPDPDDSATHIVLKKGTTAENLPKVKAGARVKLLVDSIGPISLPLTEVKFPYVDKDGQNRTATVKNPVVNHYPDGNQVNRWEIDFWTNANLDVCPTGTVVEMSLSGDAGAGGIASLSAPPYAAGIFTTEGSIYEDWTTVIQGSN